MMKRKKEDVAAALRGPKTPRHGTPWIRKRCLFERRNPATPRRPADADKSHPRIGFEGERSRIPHATKAPRFGEVRSPIWRGREIEKKLRGDTQGQNGNGERIGQKIDR